jgi:hypothetical protein
MVEIPKPIENLYEIGIRTYQERISQIISKMEGKTNIFDIVEAIEEVERLELGIKQNQRRNDVFIHGQPITFKEGIAKRKENV